MAHYAFIDENNIVTEVIVGREESDLPDGVTSWEEYYGAVRGQRCLRTSYNTRAGVHIEDGEPFRGNYAGIGFTYSSELDAFLPLKSFDSWVLNESTFTYEAPIPMPEDGLPYEWDETLGDWVEIQEPSA